MSDTKTTAVKSTETAKEAYKIVKKMYSRAREAMAQGAPVAWVMAASIAEEMLYTMDVVPIYTENYGAVCAAKKGAAPLLMAAEAEGYSNVICGYVRTGIGHCIKRKELGRIPPDAPEGGMADPTLLIGSSTGCDPRFKWYQALGRYLDVPYFALDAVMPPPSVDPDEIREYYVAYLIKELKKMKEFLEKTLGRKMDESRLMEAVITSEQTKTWWWKCYEIRRAVPCPMPTEDMLSCVAPGMYYPSYPESMEFYKKLYAELEERVKHKISVVPDEKYRLLWGGGLPPWHSMNIFNFFEQLGAVFVIETCYCQYEPLEDAYKYNDPIERLARWHFNRMSSKHKKALQKGTGSPRIQRLLDWIDEYKTDGLVMHSSVSCRATTIGQIFYKNVIQDYVKIPTLFMESDLVDERNYSEAQTKANVSAFIDILEAYKEKRRQT